MAARELLIDRIMNDRGGLIRTAELHACGFEKASIEIFVRYTITRVRRGWYANHNADPTVVRAVRVGGRLACRSALAYRGVAASPAELHLAVPRSASGLRCPDDEKLRLDARRDRVVVHWESELSGDRCAVSVEQAHRQARWCDVGRVGA